MARKDRCDRHRAGAWCPYCNAQLSAFQPALDGLAEMDVRVVALSVDDEATTQERIA
jgi:peroxiredoxin